MVEVNQQYRATLLIIRGALEGALDTLGEQQAVGQVAQWVVMRQVIQLAL